MGMLADRAGGEKKVVLTCLIMTLFLTAGVYAARKVFWPLLLLYGTVAFFDKAVSPLMDSWIVRSKRGKEALPYGKIRAVGSLGGALCAVGTGALIDAAGFGAVFLLHMGMTALLILGTVRVRDGIKEREKKKTDEAISAGDGADMAQNGGGHLLSDPVSGVRGKESLAGHYLLPWLFTPESCCWSFSPRGFLRSLP